MSTAASRWMRQLHRWLSIAFTLTVVANFAVRTQGEPPAWVTYAPLFPLALLLRDSARATAWAEQSFRRICSSPSASSVSISYSISIRQTCPTWDLEHAS